MILQLNLSKYPILMVFSLHLYALNVVQTKESYITECNIVPLYTSTNFTKLVFGCSSNSEKEITPTIRTNVSELSCNNETIELDNVIYIAYENCSFQSLPHQMLKNFNTIHTLNLAQLSLDVLKSNDLPAAPAEDDALDALILSENNVKHIEHGVFRHQQTMEALHLDFNQLQYVNEEMLSGLSALHFLSFAHNKISAISERAFQHLSKLCILLLNHNQIRSIGDTWFGEQNQLQTLDLANNSISYLSPNKFVRVPNLIDLDLSWNQIDELPTNVFAPLIHLHNLRLEHNRIYIIDDSWIGTVNKLKFLNLQRNDLTALKRNYFVDLTELIDLDVGYSKVAYIQDGTFETLQNLRALNLTNNRLMEFNVTALFSPEENCLEYLDLGDNLVNELSDGFEEILPQLKNVTFNSNKDE